ncbi:3571_t:CDS:2, partial [Cetraspora pellucida]
FKSSVDISDKTLIKIASSYPNLKHLNLWDNRIITDEGLCQIAQSYNKLEYLNISYSYWITDRTVSCILNSCSNLRCLEYLDFAYVMAFRNNSLIVAIIGSSPNLKYLIFLVVEVVASTCHKLEYLDLGRVGGGNTSNEQNLEENPMSSYLPLPNPIFTDIIDESDFISAFRFLEISMCSNKLLKKIGSIISRKLTPEKKNNKFVREETTAPLGLIIIPPTFFSNIKNNACLSNKKSIMIPTKVLIEKSNPKTHNYILLGNNWFYDRKYNNDELQTYIPEIVIDTEDAFAIISVNKRDIHDFYKILPRKSKDSLYCRSNISITSDSSTSNVDSISSSSLAYALHNGASISDTNLIIL